MPEYEAWNAALSERFLQGQTGVPLYLYTDDAVLEEVAGDLGIAAHDAVESFLAAVRGVLYRGEPFAPWAKVARAEVGAKGRPSYLALLCFLVFVAVERETVHFQYYPELNRYLRTDAAGAPPGFDRDVQSLFRAFNEWLEGSGAAHGIPTAAPASHYPNIGWPLSQAIVRPSDRAHILRLFHQADLRPGAALDGSALRLKVVRFLRTGAASPSQVRLLSLDDSQRAVFEDVLTREFASWDGSATQSTGPARVFLRVCYDQSSGDWWLLAPRVEGTSGRRWAVGSASGTVSGFKGIEAEPAELWSLVGAGDVGKIESGPILVSRNVRVRWLTPDFAAGGWAEVQRRDLDVTQLALLRAGDRHVVEGHPGLVVRDDAPAGYLLVEVGAGVDLESQVTSPTVGQVRPPAPPSFAGGLRLAAATSSYLAVTAGAPDVVDLGEAVAVDGSDVSAAADAGVLRLRDLDLAVGNHEVVTGGESLSVRLVDRLVEGPLADSGADWISDLQAPARTLVPWESGSIWLVGPHGELDERTVRRGTWVEVVGLAVNEVEVNGLIAGSWFVPSYVVSARYMGKPWVEPVDTSSIRGAGDGDRRHPDATRARAIVQALMVDYGPVERHDDKAWKKTFAAMLRTAHR